MKKSGILNKDLMAELTGLGHLDSFVICDAGFPIPYNAKKIDLAIIENLPTFLQILKAVLNEVIVEKITMLQETKKESIELYDELNEIFVKQDKAFLEFDKFYKVGVKAKFFIRTADFTPYANIILKSASGVKKYSEIYDIRFSK